jgi:integrase
MKRHRRGSGCVFTAGSKTKWIRYYVNGRAVTENTHSTDQKTAEGLLQARVYEAGQGIVSDSGASKITVGSLYEAVERNYRINERKSMRDLKMRWEKHLQPFFGHYRPGNVSTDLIDRYIDKRKQECAANASINRELAVLKRAFYMGQECTPPKVRAVPYFRMLKEDNVRRGFLEIRQYESLSRGCAKVGLWMRTLFELGFTYGWRHAELLGLRVDQVSIVERTIRLDPGRTKNDKGREVTLTPLLCQLLQECIRGKQPHEHLITRDDGSHVADFRETWERVIKGAGVPDLLFHDLRRTAVRNMIRAGISERVAMEISGHKTRSVFDRYNIRSQADISDAVEKLVSQRTVRVEAEIVELPAMPQNAAARLN